jgi:pilus assembly protein CpaB
VPGARVDVLVTRDGGEGGPGAAELALQDVEVLAARPASPQDASRSTGPLVAATLRVTVRQAVFLAASQSFAREIRLLVRAPGDRARTGAARVESDLGD